MVNLKKIYSILPVSAALICLTLFAWFHPEKETSLSERRKLAQMPLLTWEMVTNGKFMKNFESYAQDQFPLRETMRKIAAEFSEIGLGKTDYHGVYEINGSAAKVEHQVEEESIQHAAERFSYLYSKYLEGVSGNIYTAVIPDKGYYLGKENGYPYLEVDEISNKLSAAMPFAENIDLKDTLTIDSFYKTDPHWKQEEIKSTAEKLAEALGVEIKETYEPQILEGSFQGTYAGQLPKELDADTITYMTNSILENCVVFNYETNQETGIYDLEKGKGKDPYELYLSGPVSLLTITNPAAEKVNHLILFRDSFGSSITPYLAEAYQKITLIDIRYLQPDFLGKFVDFTNADVLFLYSSSVLNHSETIK